MTMRIADFAAVQSLHAELVELHRRKGIAADLKGMNITVNGAYEDETMSKVAQASVLHEYNRRIAAVLVKLQKLGVEE